MDNIINSIRDFFEGTGWSGVVTVALILSVVFWALCLLGIVYLYIRDYRHKKYYNRIYPSIRDFVYEYILDANINNHFPIDRLDLSLDDSLVRKVVREVLHEYIYTIGGEKNKNIRNLFIELGFEKEAQYELRQSITNVPLLVRSLSDLSIINIPIKDDIKKKLLNSPTEDIRVAVSKYMVQVEGEDSLDNVFESLHSITELNALELYQSIIMKGFFEGYSFSRWIAPSKSFEVNGFFMNLMIHYQQLDEEVLWNLINTDNEKRTVIKAVNTLGKLLAKDSEEALVRLYNESKSTNLNQEIIKALGRLGQGKSSDLLSNIFRDPDSSITLKKHAYRSLLNQAPYNRAIIQRLEEGSNEENLRIIRYVGHPMVHYI